MGKRESHSRRDPLRYYYVSRPGVPSQVRSGVSSECVYMPIYKYEEQYARASSFLTAFVIWLLISKNASIRSQNVTNSISKNPTDPGSFTPLGNTRPCGMGMRRMRMHTRGEDGEQIIDSPSFPSFPCAETPPNRPVARCPVMQGNGRLGIKPLVTG